MFNSLLKFVQDTGLSATCKHQLSHCFRLLDDDFDIIDDDMTFQNEARSSSEQVDNMLDGVDACKYDFHEKTSISTSASTSTYDFHEEASISTSTATYDFDEEAPSDDCVLVNIKHGKSSSPLRTDSANAVRRSPRCLQLRLTQ